VFPEVSILGKLEVTSMNITFTYDREWVAKAKASSKSEADDYTLVHFFFSSCGFFSEFPVSCPFFISVFVFRDFL
jgi:hypothetical protein